MVNKKNNKKTPKHVLHNDSEHKLKNKNGEGLVPSLRVLDV